MAKMHTPAMERIERKNAKRKKPVKSTPAYESWKRFKRNPTALIGLAVVCILILIAVFANFIAPYDAQVQDYMAMMQKPSSAHLFGTDQFGRDILRRCLPGDFWESLPDISAALWIRLLCGSWISFRRSL